MNIFVIKTIRYFVVVFGLIIFALHYFRWLKTYIKFRDYLYDKNDLEMIKMIGGLEEIGLDTKRRSIGSMSSKTTKKLLERYEQTEDKYYDHFYKDTVEYGRKGIAITLIAFSLFSVTFVIEELFLTSH